MTLSWSDGFEVVVEYKQLRYWCPLLKCAPKRDSEATAEILTNEISKYKSGIPEVKKVGDMLFNLIGPMVAAVEFTGLNVFGH